MLPPATAAEAEANAQKSWFLVLINNMLAVFALGLLAFLLSVVVFVTTLKWLHT